MVGIAGLCGLAANLLRMPPRLPLFCFLSHRLRHFHCGQDLVARVGDKCLRSSPQCSSVICSSSVYREFASVDFEHALTTVPYNNIKHPEVTAVVIQFFINTTELN